MNTPIERHIALDGICNMRDLGGYPVADGGSVRWRRVLRSDSLHTLDRRGMDALVDAGLARVIDLRDASEIARQPNPFRAHRTVHYTQIPLFAHLDLQEHIAGTTGAGDVLLTLYCKVLAQRQPALFEALSAICEKLRVRMLS
jgi:protein-tyrosine phosphatase